MPPVLLNSITDAGATAKAAVVITGSHGGVYAAYLASKAGIRAVIFNDAGIGLDDAGVAGMLALGRTGMAAAAVAHTSARIGDAGNMRAQGIISMVNDVAAALGVSAGMKSAQAADLLDHAEPSVTPLPPVEEARQFVRTSDAPDILLVDSASLVTPDDAERVIITGSHGGLIGGDPARAIKADASLVVFNDAGGGLDDAGITRLPALNQRSIAAVTVAHTSARIGDARSAWETGKISHANAKAVSLGATIGGPLKDWVIPPQ